jgi:hypothetical protein
MGGSMYSSRYSLNLLVLAACLFFTATVFAETEERFNSQKGSVTSIITSVPRSMTYHGILKDSTFTPVPDSVYEVTFRIYNTDSGGSSLWEETHPCTTRAGVFTTKFSDVSLPFDEDYWVELEVDSEIMTPRQQITMSGYAARADTCDYAFNSAAIANGWVDDGSVVRLENAGDDVGIGTSSPNAKLDIDGGLHVSANANIGNNNNHSGTDVLVVGYMNTVNGDRSTIAGGSQNSITGNNSGIVSGISNSVNDNYGIIGGGQSNRIYGLESSVVGGRQNWANGDYCGVVSGISNIAGNTSSDSASFIGGGQGNQTHAPFTAICGGKSNQAGYACFIGGGISNIATGDLSVVGGGESDTAQGTYAGAFSGFSNLAGNGIDDTASFVGGGWDNTITGKFSTIAGGYENHIESDYSAIIGGYGDTISSTGDRSYLFGIGSKLTQDSTFMVDMPHIRFGDETNGYEFPASDGSVDQIIATDGSGNLSWVDIPGSVGFNWTVSDSVLYTNNFWGIARGGAGNVLYGDSVHTMVNLGVACTTGTEMISGLNATVCGGRGNKAGGKSSTIAGGENNKTFAETVFIGGGRENWANGLFAVIGGGFQNKASGTYGFIGGGFDNFVNVGGGLSTIGGGISNKANGGKCAIGGGELNTAIGTYSVIGGGKYDSVNAAFGGVFSGSYNVAGTDELDTAAFIGGGYNNSATAKYATVSGGFQNTASGEKSTVGGGNSNTASGTRSVVGGGTTNIADGYISVVAGGNGNNASSHWTTVGGGLWNTAGSQRGTVGGGQSNEVNGFAGTIAGGYYNVVDADFGGVAAGKSNTAGDDYSDTSAFVGGGTANLASAKYATIGGGYDNEAIGYGGTVGGGEKNVAGSVSAFWSTVAGGYSNSASGYSSTVGGGYRNTANSNSGTVCGGNFNHCAGNYSTLAGGNADTITTNGIYSLAFGSQVYIDNSFRAVFFNSDWDGRLGINRDDRDTGGIAYPIHVGTNSANGNGAHLTAGGTWANGSSRQFKEDFRKLDRISLLGKISEIPVEIWNYKDSDEKHIGPMAEDFVDAFGVGAIRESDGQREDRYLAASDVAGVALAGVKELIQENRELKDLIIQLENRIARLEKEN